MRQMMTAMTRRQFGKAALTLATGGLLETALLLRN
jgi:hypothetical protein